MSLAFACYELRVTISSQRYFMNNCPNCSSSVVCLRFCPTNRLFSLHFPNFAKQFTPQAGGKPFANPNAYPP